ncbi:MULTISPECIES: hypothetical protein [unclassified Corynebacterium]|nr:MULTISPECIES: hypothetical protein [unclassified Corynebacterium]
MRAQPLYYRPTHNGHVVYVAATPMLDDNGLSERAGLRPGV